VNAVQEVTGLVDRGEHSIPAGGKVYIGIDNGISGAIAVVAEDRNSAFVLPIPIICHSAIKRKRDKETGKMVNSVKKSNSYDAPSLANLFRLLIRDYDIRGVYLEQAQVMQRDGKVSAGKAMVGFGIMQGVLAALGVSYSLVAPQTWQSRLIKGVIGVDTKERSFKVAKTIYPFMHDSLARVNRNGRTEINDGACDAILLAELALRDFAAFGGGDGPEFNKRKTRAGQ